MSEIQQQTHRVLLRIRPSEEPQNLLVVQDPQTIVINGPKPEKAAAKSGSGPQYQFKFDSVLQAASQEDVYQAAGADVLKSALEGYNGTIMCYGQTGAGKTYTMSGGRKQTFAQRGLIPRVITQLFSELRSTPSQECKVNISYLEIYNDGLFDLLDISTAPHEINVYEDRASKVTIVGLRTVTVESEKEALALLFEGEANRVISEHQLNRESSRSHAIFTISLEMRPANDLSGTAVTSKLNLVDLAGSERVSKTRSEGTVLKEAAHINRSLSILEQVVLALGEGAEHVPFRSSKLTHVLKDAVGGNCKTVMVANVWGEASQVNETLSTCRFAMRLLRLKCRITPNIIEDAGSRIRALQSQVKDLQQQLSGQKGGALPLLDASTDSSNLDEHQRAMIKHQVSRFLAAPCTSCSLEPLDLASLAVVHEVLLQLRQLYQQHARAGGAPLAACAGSTGWSGTAQGLQHAQQQGGAAGGRVPGTAKVGQLPPLQQQHVLLPPPLPPPQHWETVGVGEVEDAALGGHQAGGVGVAPEPLAAQHQGAQGGTPGSLQAAVPPVRLAPSQQHIMPSSCSSSTAEVGTAPPGSVRGSGGAVGGAAWGVSREGSPRGGATRRGGENSTASGWGAGTRLSREAASEVYKQGPGAAKAALLLENKARLKELKKRAKDLGLSINAAKQELDTIKAQAEAMKAGRQAQGMEKAQMLSTDEYNALMRIKELKTQYKDQFTELQMVRSEVDYTQQLFETCTKEFLEDFNAWFSTEHGGSKMINGQHEWEDDGTSETSYIHVIPSSMPSQHKAGCRSQGHSREVAADTARPGLPGPAKGAAKTGMCLGISTVRSTASKAQQQSQKPAPNEIKEPGAAAYYAAQKTLAGASGPNSNKPGSLKKRAGGPPPF